jgi:hypothetical protein
VGTSDARASCHGRADHGRAAACPAVIDVGNPRTRACSASDRRRLGIACLPRGLHAHAIPFAFLGRAPAAASARIGSDVGFARAGLAARCRARTVMGSSSWSGAVAWSWTGGPRLSFLGCTSGAGALLGRTTAGCSACCTGCPLSALLESTCGSGLGSRAGRTPRSRRTFLESARAGARVGPGSSRQRLGAAGCLITRAADCRPVVGRPSKPIGGSRLERACGPALGYPQFRRARCAACPVVGRASGTCF